MLLMCFNLQNFNLEKYVESFAIWTVQDICIWIKTFLIEYPDVDSEFGHEIGGFDPQE